MADAFAGCYTVAVTPFTDDGSAVDVSRLRNFLDWQVESGVPGVIVLGTTGEFIAVSPRSGAPSSRRPSPTSTAESRCWWAR